MKLPVDVQQRLMHGTALEWLGVSKVKFEPIGITNDVPFTWIFLFFSDSYFEITRCLNRPMYLRAPQWRIWLNCYFNVYGRINIAGSFFI